MYDHDDDLTIDDCVLAMDQVYSFLHGELDEETSDHIRQHLMTCEQCLDSYDVESLITVLIKRSCGASTASVALRERVSYLHVAVQ